MDRLTPRLLIVDDDDAVRATLVEMLQRDEYYVTGVEDGPSAVAAVRSARFDAALLDIDLPGLDGFDVLTSIREQFSPAMLPIIMVTGMSGRDEVVKALRLGANDYVTKPLDMPIVRARLQTQIALKRAAADLERANRELAQANRQMKADLESAARLQRSLLPTAMPDVSGVRFAWVHQPCEELAGDILNVFEIDARHVGLYLLDVSGHGVKAALLSTALSRILSPQPDQSSLVRRRTETGDLEPTPPHDVALELNHRFPFDDQNEQYFTLFYGVLDTRRLELRYVNAGQPGPIYIPAREPPRDLAAAMFAIGWVSRPPYQEHRLLLRPGDRVIAYSDGLGEARNPQRQLFGSSRIASVASESRGIPLAQTLEGMVEAARRWTGGAFDDDVSALAIEAC